MDNNPWLFDTGVVLVLLMFVYAFMCVFFYWLNRSGIVFMEPSRYGNTKQEQREARQQALADSVKFTARLISFWPLAAVILVTGVILLVV